MVKNPGNGRLNNLNDPVLSVLKCLCAQRFKSAPRKGRQISIPARFERCWCMHKSLQMFCCVDW